MTKATMTANAAHLETISKMLVANNNNHNKHQEKRTGSENNKFSTRKEDRFLSYFWSCGVIDNLDHSSPTCRNQNKGHISTVNLHNRQDDSNHN